MKEYCHVPKEEMRRVFYQILVQNNFPEKKAACCADIFTANSLDGVYTHGVNRFPRFVEYVRQGVIKPDAEPTFTHGFGALEQWNGNYGPGPLNAVHATERAMKLAHENGMGCVALAHTNHWMRGGYYGWQAAKKGCVFIGWSNTLANMPAWGAVDSRLGNNPLVLALPMGNEALVLDTALSQFSYGALEQAALKGEELPVAGGYNERGELTKNPSEIIAAKRPVPIGFWKGAGLSLLLDVLAVLLSGGLATHQISKQKWETGLSQVFIAFDVARLGNHALIQTAINQIIADYHDSVAADGQKISFPGERVVNTRKKNSEEGIPVLKEVWQSVLQLAD